MKLGISSLVLILSCSSSNEQDTTNSLVNINLPNNIDCRISSSPQDDSPYYQVLADKNLSNDNKLSLSDSLSEWCYKTNFVLRFNIEFVDMSKEDLSINLPHQIHVIEENLDPPAIGSTIWFPDNFSAYISIKNNLDSDIFRRVLLHELGHSFDLKFNNKVHYNGTYKSVMYEDIKECSEHLSCPELKAFCINFNCNVDCIFVNQKIITTDRKAIKSPILDWEGYTPNIYKNK